MEIINSHAHIYPEKIAKKATDTIGVFYDIKMQMPAGTPERLLEDGDEITLGNEVIKVISTPGHSKGSVCYYIPGERTMFTGDLLFAQGYGRADLHGGNAFTLRTSLCALRKYPKNITIYPGHGESALLGNALDVAFYL